MRSAPTGSDVVVRFPRCRGGEPTLDLGLDLTDELRFGLEGERALPLVACLLGAADAPIRIAEVVVDHRILRLEFDRTLQVGYGFLVFADAIEQPAERVHDVT